MTRTVSDAINIPAIAFGGVGNLQHLAAGILLGKADAVLVANIFPFAEYTIKKAKIYLASQGIELDNTQIECLLAFFYHYYSYLHVLGVCFIFRVAITNIRVTQLK